MGKGLYLTLVFPICQSDSPLSYAWSICRHRPFTPSGCKPRPFRSIRDLQIINNIRRDCTRITHTHTHTHTYTHSVINQLHWNGRNMTHRHTYRERERERERKREGERGREKGEKERE